MLTFAPVPVTRTALRVRSTENGALNVSFGLDPAPPLTRTDSSEEAVGAGSGCPSEPDSPHPARPPGQEACGGSEGDRGAQQSS